MDQVKAFATGKTMANNLALFAAIGAASYYQFSQQNKHTPISKDPVESETDDLEQLGGEEVKPNNKKYLLWGLVVLFMVPLVIDAMSSKKTLPNSSFQARVTEAANKLRAKSPVTPSVNPEVEDDFKKRVAEAARKLREQIAESSAMMPNDDVVETSSDMAVKAGEEIKKFLSENS